MAAPASLNPGQILGHFRVVEEIGAGGMGIVYRAWDMRLERDVAVKVLNPFTLNDGSSRKRFRHEALILSRLNHPNVEAVYDFHTEQDLDYLVMEYVPGVSLSERLDGGALAEKEVLGLGIQLARGLAAAHAKRVIHRDLKPSNLRVTQDGVLKILDFGLAQLSVLPDDETLSDSASTLQPGAGTPPYLSPEQVQGKEPDVRSDIYSAGVVLYEMATGTRPFQQKGQSLRDAIVKSMPVAPRDKNRHISPGLNAVVLKCLEKDPKLRYQSASELLAELERLGASRNSRIFVAWTAAVLLGIGGGILAGKRLRQPAEPPVKHVAVLPFHMTGAQPQEAALFDGLTDTVTNRLMQLTASQPVGIIPFSEITANHVTNMQEARSKLGANLALDGNLQRNGDQLRVNLALSEIPSHMQLQAETVSGRAADFKQLEADVVDAAMNMLEFELHKGKSPGDLRNTTSSEAYQAVVRGQDYLSRNPSQEDNGSARTEFTRALELDPGYAAAYSLLGRAYWANYQLTKDESFVPKIKDACAHALRLAPSSAGANSCTGVLEEATGHYQQAAAKYQLALDADPADDFVCHHLGQAYEHLGRLQQAEQTYQNAIQLHPKNAGDYTWLGALYNREARYSEAAVQFRHAVELEPDNAGHWSRLGGTYFFAGDYPAAEAALSKAIALQPSAASWSNLGETYFLERKFEDAVKAFQQSTALGERQLFAYSNLARTYYWYPPMHNMAKPTLAKAIELAESDLSLNQNDVAAHTFLAEDYAMMGDKKAALSHLESSLRLDPSNPETYYFAGKVYNLLGEREQALKWLEKSVRAGYSLAEISHTIELDSLRGDRRFQALSHATHS